MEEKTAEPAFGLSLTGPGEFASSRTGLVDDWIRKGAPSVGARQQKAEALEHFMGSGRSGGRMFDKLLGAAPGSMRAALARAAYRRKAKGPLRNEALAHFYGGYKANKNDGLVGRIGTGIKDMQFAMQASPTIKSDFHNLARNALVGGAGMLALRKMMQGRKDRQQEQGPAPTPWPTAAPEALGAEEAPKLANMNTMESQRLLRRLKMARGSRGGAQLLRVLEARLVTDVKRKQSKKKTSKKKKS